MKLLLTKRNEWGDLAARYFATLPGENHIVRWSDKPAWIAYNREDGDELYSFCWPEVIPEAALNRFVRAVNFHPGSTDYPGIGCYNFALYEGAREYGAVAHHMAPGVDSGPILEEDRFIVHPSDTVASLQVRTMVVLLGLFARLLGGYFTRTPGAEWRRKPFTRADLDELCVVTPEMDESEIRRRVRAVDYPGYPGARVDLGGVTFEAKR